MNRGVIYLATGKKIYLDECAFSAASLKKHCPDIPITLYTDNSDVKNSCFDEVVIIKNDLHPMQNKVKYLPMSPYKHTLYLDCDTQILKPIYEMFEWLNECDLGVANTPHRELKGQRKLIDYEKPDRYNTGVLLYKKSGKTEVFFSEWLKSITSEDKEAKRLFGRYGDQYYFNKLTGEDYHKKCEIELKVFPNKIYNVRQIILKQLKKEGKTANIKIVHRHYLHMNPLMLVILLIYRKLKNQRIWILTRPGDLESNEDATSSP